MGVSEGVYNDREEEGGEVGTPRTATVLMAAMMVFWFMSVWGYLVLFAGAGRFDGKMGTRESPIKIVTVHTSKLNTSARLGM